MDSVCLREDFSFGVTHCWSIERDLLTDRWPPVQRAEVQAIWLPLGSEESRAWLSLRYSISRWESCKHTEMGRAQCQTGAERRWENKSKGTEDELKELKHSCVGCLRGITTQSKQIRRCTREPHLQHVHLRNGRACTFHQPVFISCSCKEDTDANVTGQMCNCTSSSELFCVLFECFPHIGGVFSSFLPQSKSKDC